MQKKTSPELIEDREGQVVHKERPCEKCDKNGKTKETYTKIQNFKDVIVVEFECKECDHTCEFLDFVEKKNDFGIEILYKVAHQQDKERPVIHSENASITITELDHEISLSTKSQQTTIKGILQRTIQQLNQMLTSTQLPQQQLTKLKTSLDRAQQVLQGNLLPLTIKIRDPSGNSNIKNLNYPLPDKNIQVCYFQRNIQELMGIGFTQAQAEEQVKKAEEMKKGIKLNFNKPFEEKDFMHKQPVIFEVPCHTCMMPGEMKLCETSVPYFTDLVIMSFSCEYCGAHSVQTKNSGEVHDQALEITLKVDTDQDLKRDLFKSDTCKVCIPQVQLQLDYGTLGGQYTTVQGLLEKVHDHLSGRNPFIDMDNQFSQRMKQFLNDLLTMRDGKKPFTLKLIDPLSRSFLQNPFHPQEDKKAIRVSRPRNEEQEEVLGFDCMNVDNYLPEHFKAAQEVKECKRILGG